MAEPVKITCPHCAAAFNIKSQSAFGKKVKCPKCATPFVIQKPAPKKPKSRKQQSSTVGSKQDAFFEEEDDEPIFLEDDADDWEDDFYESPAQPAQTPRRSSARNRKSQPNFLSSLQQQGVLPYIAIPVVGLILLVLIVGGLRMLPGKRGLTPVRRMALTGLKEFNLRPHKPHPLQWAEPGKTGDNVFQEIKTASIGRVFEVTSTPDPNYKEAPAGQMKFRVFLPPNADQAKKVPCVIVPPAGSTLLTGMGIDNVEDIPNPEHEPYLKAGFAVITFSIDGDLGEGDLTSDAEFINAHHAFRFSRAGLFNYAQALSQALYTVPEINSDQIFIAGHSSAATLSLLFAEHYQQYFQDPGVIKGCLAYAPSVDPKIFFADHMARIKPSIPDVDQFIKLSSPSEHYQKLACPVFLFHSRGDQVTSFQSSKRFADLLKNKGFDVKFVASNGSDHYQTMLDEGIPQGIQWIQSRLNQSDQKQGPSQAEQDQRLAEMKRAAMERVENLRMKKQGIRPENPVRSKALDRMERMSNSLQKEKHIATYKIAGFDSAYEKRLKTQASFVLNTLEMQLGGTLNSILKPNPVDNVIINLYQMTLSFEYTGDEPPATNVLKTEIAEGVFGKFTKVLHLADAPPQTKPLTEVTEPQENDFDVLTMRLMSTSGINFNPIAARRLLERELVKIEHYIPNSAVINYDDKWACIKFRPNDDKNFMETSVSFAFSRANIHVREEWIKLTPEQMALNAGPTDPTTDSMPGTTAASDQPAAAKQKYIIRYGVYGGDDITDSARRCLKGFVWVEQDSVHFNPDRKEITFENRSPVDEGALGRALQRNKFFQVKIAREAVPQAANEKEPAKAGSE